MKDWSDALKAKREQYIDLKDQLYPDFNKVSEIHMTVIIMYLNYKDDVA